jgi:hypothetical protein
MTTNTVPLQCRIDEKLDSELRVFAATHRIKRPAVIIEAALKHCLNNSHFIEKLAKKEEEIDH